MRATVNQGTVNPQAGQLFKLQVGKRAQAIVQALNRSLVSLEELE